MQSKYDIRYRIVSGEFKDGDEKAEVHRLILENYTQVESVLGRGSYGCVLQLRNTHGRFAVKVQLSNSEGWPFEPEIVESMNTAALNRMDSVAQDRPRICGGFVRMYDAFRSRTLLDEIMRQKTFLTNEDRLVVYNMTRHRIKVGDEFQPCTAHFAVFENMDTTFDDELRRRYRPIMHSPVASECRALLEFLRATVFQIFYSLLAAHRMCGFTHGDLKGNNIMLKRVAPKDGGKTWTFDCGADGLFCVPPDAADHMVTKIIDMGMSRLNLAYQADDERTGDVYSKMFSGCWVKQLERIEQSKEHIDYVYLDRWVDGIFNSMDGNFVQRVYLYTKEYMPNSWLPAEPFSLEKKRSFLFLDPIPGLDTSTFARYFLYQHGDVFSAIYMEANRRLAVESPVATRAEREIWSEVIKTCLELREFLILCTPELSAFDLAMDQRRLWRLKLSGSAHSIIYPDIANARIRDALRTVSLAYLLQSSFLGKFKTSRSKLREEMVDKTMWFFIPNEGHGISKREWVTMPDLTSHGVMRAMNSSQ